MKNAQNDYGQKQPLTDVLQNRCSYNIADFTRKRLCQSLWRPEACYFFKKRLQHKIFGKFIRTPFLQNTSGSYFCTVSDLQSCSQDPRKHEEKWNSLQLIKCQCCPHIETSQLICFANQLSGFFMRAALAFNWLNNISHRFC